MHATAMFRIAAKLLTIASWMPVARQMGIVREAVAMLKARASVAAPGGRALKCEL